MEQINGTDTFPNEPIHLHSTVREVPVCKIQGRVGSPILVRLNFVIDVFSILPAREIL